MTFPLRAGKSGRKAARRTFLFPLRLSAAAHEAGFSQCPCRALLLSASALPPCSRKSRSLCSLRFSVSLRFYILIIYSQEQKPRFLRLRTRPVFRNALSGIARFRLGSAALFTKISLALLPAIFRESAVLYFNNLLARAKITLFALALNLAIPCLTEGVKRRHFIICVP